MLRSAGRSGGFGEPRKVRAVVPGELKGPGGDFHSAVAKLTYGWAGAGCPAAWPFSGVGVRAGD